MFRHFAILLASLVLILTASPPLAAADPLKSGMQPGEKITTIFEPLNVTGEHAGEPYCLICENGLSPVVMLFAREPSEPLFDLIARIDAAASKNRDDNAAGRQRELEDEKQGLSASFAAQQRLRTAESNLEAAKRLAEKKIATPLQVQKAQEAHSEASKKYEAAQSKLSEIRKREPSSAYAEEVGSFVVFLSDKEELPDQLKEAAKKRNLKHIVLSTFDPDGPDGFNVSKDADLTVVLYTDHLVKANHAFRKGELTPASIEKILADLPKILTP